MENEITLAKQEETSIVVQNQWTANDVIQQVQLIQQVMKKAMKDGEHFGKIPGCGDKPALLKAGAEKLGLTFRLAPQFKITKTDLPNNHREYEIVCSLIHIPSGQMWGEGVGSCSTMESKYRFRNANLKCPKCGKETIIKGKKEYGGGWLCWTKKGGCGAKFKDDDPEIKDQEVGKIENDNPANEYNTVLKMAKKRAHVDAMLTATAASDIFTQDIEEFSDNGVIVEQKKHDIEEAKVIEEKTTEKSVKKPAKKTQNIAEEKITPAQWTQLCKTAMTCKNPKGVMLGIPRMFETIKTKFNVKLGTDLTIKQLEVVENELLHKWESGEWHE